MGAVTVITSGKGGVGKSTVCAGLGRVLAERRRRVLLIDGDAGLRSLDRMLALDDQVMFDISDVVSGSCEPIRAIYECGVPGLYLMPAPYREEKVVSPHLMRQLVPILSRYYDHVLIDCPAGLGAGFESAAAAAQRALVVATPDPLCLRGSDKVRLLLTQAGISSQRLVVKFCQIRLVPRPGQCDRRRGNPADRNCTGGPGNRRRIYRRQASFTIFSSDAGVSPSGRPAGGGIGSPCETGKAVNSSQQLF